MKKNIIWKIICSVLSLVLLISSCSAAPKKKHKKRLHKTSPITHVLPASEIAPPAITLATNNPTLSPLIMAAVKMDTQAAQAIVTDHTTGRVILEKNADERVYPSSMTKIMTAYMIFDRLKKGLIQLETPLMISEKAWKMGGSKMFVNVNTAVTVKDLLHGVIIQSGNDACVALAEGLSGSEDVFAAEMTQRAQELGAVHSLFKNASGWPNPDHLSTVRDLSLIARHLINDYPEYYGLFAEKEFTYGNITQPNRNPLLAANIGCDGLKTGFTDIGKYGLVASAKEVGSDGVEKRFNIVINGLPSSKARALEATKLMTWALKNFASIRVAQANQVLEKAPVWLGEEETIPLTISQDIYITIPEVSRKEVETHVIYDRPLNAPLGAGQTVGKMVINAPTLETPLEIPLITAVEVKKAGFFKRIRSSISYLIWG